MPTGNKQATTPMLLLLPEQLLLLVLHNLPGDALARLDCTCRRLRRWSTTEPHSLPELVAEQLCCSRYGGRVQRATGESWAWLLHLLGRGLLPPLRILGAGCQHTVVVCAEEGSVLTSGSNWCGQLGHARDSEPIMHHAGDMGAATLSARAVPLSGVVAVSCGFNHTVALSSDGSVFSWGSGDCGQLGLVEVEPDGGVVVPAPRRVAPRRPAMRRLVVDATIGQVGGEVKPEERDGSSATRPLATPRQGGFPTGTRVTDITAGGDSTACVTATGELWSWGDGSDGQLGHGNRECVMVPKRVEAVRGRRVTDVALSTAGDGMHFTVGNFMVCIVAAPAAPAGAGHILQCGGGMSMDSSHWLIPRRISHCYEYYLSQAHAPTCPCRTPGGIHTRIRTREFFARRVSAGCAHWAAISECGRLYVSSMEEMHIRSANGGENDLICRPEFVRVESQRVVSVSCSYGATAAISEDGVCSLVREHGRTLGGGEQRGTAEVTDCERFAGGAWQTEALPRATEVSCGNLHYAVRTEAGEVHCAVLPVWLRGMEGPGPHPLWPAADADMMLGALGVGSGRRQESKASFFIPRSMMRMEDSEGEDGFREQPVLT